MLKTTYRSGVSHLVRCSMCQTKVPRDSKTSIFTKVFSGGCGFVSDLKMVYSLKSFGIEGCLGVAGAKGLRLRI